MNELTKELLEAIKDGDIVLSKKLFKESMEARTQDILEKQRSPILNGGIVEGDEPDDDNDDDNEPEDDDFDYE